MKIKKLLFVLIAFCFAMQFSAATRPSVAEESSQSAWVGAALTVGAFVKSAVCKTGDVVKPLACNATEVVGNYIKEWKNPEPQGSKELLYTPYSAILSKKSSAKSFLVDHSSSDSDSDSSCNSGKDENFAFIARKKSIPLPFANPKEFNEGLQSNATETMHILNQAIEKYFKEQNPAELVTQKAIFQTSNCLAKSNPVVKLPAILADTYNERQRLLLVEAIDRQVKVVNHRIIKEHDLAVVQATDKRDKALAKAHARFNQEKGAADHKRDEQLLKSMQKIKLFAANSAYINSCASKQQAPHPAHDENHFKDLQAYQAFLTQISSK